MMDTEDDEEVGGWLYNNITHAELTRRIRAEHPAEEVGCAQERIPSVSTVGVVYIPADSLAESVGMDSRAVKVAVIAASAILIACTSLSAFVLATQVLL